MAEMSLSAVNESFKDYVAVETLEGDNKYDAGEHGLQVQLVHSYNTHLCTHGLSPLLSPSLSFTFPFPTGGKKGCDLPELSPRPAPAVDEVPVRPRY